MSIIYASLLLLAGLEPFVASSLCAGMLQLRALSLLICIDMDVLSNYSLGRTVWRSLTCWCLLLSLHKFPLIHTPVMKVSL